MAEATLQTFRAWTFRLRPGRGRSLRLMLLLHGWMGDENSMWVLARNLPKHMTLLAPRAPRADPQGGYTWREIRPGSWGEPTLEEMEPAARGLVDFIDAWAAENGLDAKRFDLMGFSQGALLSYSLALLYPDRIGRLAALSGFLPEGAQARLDWRQLAGRRFFVAHGRQDEMVAVERARTAVGLLEASGVSVEYCESEAAHKVSLECLRAMEAYFRTD